MFLRKMCRRILILHSYRDGRGKVCQRRLGHFHDLAGLERELKELPTRCPELHWDEAKLRDCAERLLSSSEPSRQAARHRAGQALRTLLNWLAEEHDPQDLAPQLASLRDRLTGLKLEEDSPVGRARRLLPLRRRRFDPSDPKVAPYLEALDQQAEREPDLPAKVQILAERVQACPTPQALLSYAAKLQQLGRHSEAIDHYERLPDSEGFRHYNLSSTYWQLGDFEQALLHLLRGIARQPEIADALYRMQQRKSPQRGGRYWDEFGHLWDNLGRRFVVSIARIPLVRRRLRQAQESGVKVRNLVPPSSRVWMLKRGLEAIQSTTSILA